MLLKKITLKTLFSNFSLMSIVSKMLRCTVCYRWMAHLALTVVYIEFTWNYVRFNSNDYYFMRFTHLQKSPNYANKSLNYFAVGDSWIPVWALNRSTFDPPATSEWSTGRSQVGPLPCKAEVENKQLSLWDLGLLEKYGKNNNSNRKSIFYHLAGLAGNPS